MGRRKKPSRALVVETARKYLGVPYCHQAAIAEKVDCRGLLLLVFVRELKLVECDSKHPDYHNYSRRPDETKFRTLIDRHMTEIKIDEVMPGDVLTFKGAPFTREVQHLGIVTSINPLAFIHASSHFGKVVEHDVDPMWQRMLTGAFRIPKLEGVI